MINSKYQLVFIGTGSFGSPILEALIKSEKFDVTGVITAPDRPSGRKLLMAPSDIKKTALANNLKMFTPNNKKNIENALKDLKPDICLVVAYGMILPSSILKIPKYGCINVHGSILPQYRGASPIHQAILNGDNKTGNSWIVMTEKMDAGPLIGTSTVDIGKFDMFTDLYKKLAHDAAINTPSYLMNYIQLGQYMPQDDKNASYCSKLDKSDGIIDFKAQKKNNIYNRFRAFNEWPNVYFKTKNMNIKIIQCDIYEQNNYTTYPPGTFINVDNKKLLVTTIDGAIELNQLQPPSKKPIPGHSFILGYKNELDNVITIKAPT